MKKMSERKDTSVRPFPYKFVIINYLPIYWHFDFIVRMGKDFYPRNVIIRHGGDFSHEIPGIYEIS